MTRFRAVAISVLAILGVVFPLLADPAAVGVLDVMRKQTRELQAEMQKVVQTPEEAWREALVAKTEPLMQSINDLYRAGTVQGRTISAYGLRMLINDLRSARSPEQVTQMSEQLVAVLSFLRTEHSLAAKREMAPPASEVPPDQRRELVREILKRSEFQQANKPHFFEYYINRIVVKIIAWFQGLFDSAGMQTAGKFAGILLWGAYALAAALVFWFLGRSWSPRRRASDESEADSSGGITLLAPETHLAEAESMAREGNYAGALRAYFLMMLSSLEQRHLVARNRSWTNWEYLRAFQSRVDDESLRDRMSDLNRTYDRVSYGGQPTDETSLRSFRERVNGFLSSLPANGA